MKVDLDVLKRLAGSDYPLTVSNNEAIVLLKLVQVLWAAVPPQEQKELSTYYDRLTPAIWHPES